ncbi:hypothetical protein Q1695_007227 [Nippostrongylus brasiliensis]|nr:hypothetical protein Q1695_007227 [Nippostrongylus brasiliensis]
MVHLNTTQKLALLSLYSEDIKRRLAPLYNSSDRPSVLAELLATDQFEEIRDDCIDETEFAQKLWDAFQNSPMKAVLYDSILHYLSTVDEDLHSILCCVSEKDSRSQFNKVLFYLDEFWKHLDVEVTLEYLKKIRYYENVTSRIERSLEGVEDVATKKRLVLRTIPLLGANAIYDLMRSIYYNSDKSKDFVEKLHPNFLKFYDMIDAERSSPRGVVMFCPVNVSIEDVLKDEGKHRVNLNYEDFPLGKSGKENLTIRLLKEIDARSFAETPIILRDYQKELAEKALDGMNTIIAAPTGSGKTIVAVHIIKNHLEKCRSNGRNGKVLFMTPSTVILDQQSERIRTYLGYRYQIFAVQGSDNVPLREIISVKDVIVTTPQCIVNLLNPNSPTDGIEDIVRQPFDITTFTMMVFDECHNAVKNSPYSVLMRHYHRLRFSKRIKPGSSLPQIVGMTASLGVGKGSNESDAVAHVLKLCAILNCKHISTVTRNLGELKQFSADVCDEIRFCDDANDSQRTQFLRLICDLMNIFEKHFNDIYVKYAIPSSKPTQRVVESNFPLEERPVCRTYTSFSSAPGEKSSQSYLNWVSNHLRRIVPETVFSDDVAKTLATEALEILEDLYRSIEMYQDFSSMESLKFLQSRMDERNSSLTAFSRRYWTEYSEQLSKCQSSENILIAEVVKQLLDNSSMDFRAIIFIRTRRGAVALSNLLNSHPDLVAANLQVECIAGLAKGSCETSTKRRQLEKLERFREGKTRVLVATSVADEGLDVAKCNLVIKYNYATNEIAHVQRRGRGRSEKSRSILITQNWKMKEQEERNMLRERLNNLVLRAIEEHRIDLNSRVEKAIEELWQEIQRDDANAAQQITKQEMSGVVYKLLCSKCDVVLCTSKDIKTYKNSQYCVCDPSFWSRTRKEEIQGTSARDELYHSVGKLYCISPNCNNDLGRLVNIEQTVMPVLAASAFVLTFQDGITTNRRTVKKWINVKKNYFTPREISNYDLLAMREAVSRPAIKGPSGGCVDLNSFCSTSFNAL